MICSLSARPAKKIWPGANFTGFLREVLISARYITLERWCSHYPLRYRNGDCTNTDSADRARTDATSSGALMNEKGTMHMRRAFFLFDNSFRRFPKKQKAAKSCRNRSFEWG